MMIGGKFEEGYLTETPDGRILDTDGVEVVWDFELGDWVNREAWNEILQSPPPMIVEINLRDRIEQAATRFLDRRLFNEFLFGKTKTDSFSVTFKDVDQELWNEVFQGPQPETYYNQGRLGLFQHLPVGEKPDWGPIPPAGDYYQRYIKAQKRNAVTEKKKTKKKSRKSKFAEGGHITPLDVNDLVPPTYEDEFPDFGYPDPGAHSANNNGITAESVSNATVPPPTPSLEKKVLDQVTDYVTKSAGASYTTYTDHVSGGVEIENDTVRYQVDYTTASDEDHEADGAEVDPNPPKTVTLTREEYDEWLVAGADRVAGLLDEKADLSARIGHQRNELRKLNKQARNASVIRQLVAAARDQYKAQRDIARVERDHVGNLLIDSDHTTENLLTENGELRKEVASLKKISEDALYQNKLYEIRISKYEGPTADRKYRKKWYEL